MMFLLSERYCMNQHENLHTDERLSLYFAGVLKDEDLTDEDVFNLQERVMYAIENKLKCMHSSKSVH